jgi:hypothetical protein
VKCIANLETNPFHFIHCSFVCLLVHSLPVCTTISKGTFALFGLTHPASIGTIQSFTRTFAIPFVTPSVPMRYVTKRPQIPSAASSFLRNVDSPPASGPAVAGLRSPPAPAAFQFADSFVGNRVRSEVGGVRRQSWYNSTASSSGAIAGSDLLLQPPSTSSSGHMSPSRLSHAGMPSATLGSSPVVAAAGGATVDSSGYIIHMRPTYEKAIVDVVRYYGWKRVSYVYDTNEGISKLVLHGLLRWFSVQFDFGVSRGNFSFTK